MVSTAFGKLLLSEPRLSAEFINFPRDQGVDDFLFVFSFAPGVTCDITLVEKRRGLGMKLRPGATPAGT